MESKFLVDSWLFMQSPIYILLILLFYLYFVLKLGPEFMKKRVPFTLKYILIVYNLYQVLFSTWLCCRVFLLKNSFEAIKNCDHVKLTNEQVDSFTTSAWWYFISKIVDLLDTVFFVLRKKQSQVTFLHIYHHSITMTFSWVYVKYLPDGQGIFIGLVNSLVHVVMYSYYLVAALGAKYQKHLWWKKYITWLQLIQFSVVMLYIVYLVMMNCNIPNALIYFYLVNDIFFIYLFTDFYVKAYKKKNQINLNEDNIKIK